MDFSPTASTFENESSTGTATLEPARVRPAASALAQARDVVGAPGTPSWKRTLDLSCICAALPVLVLVMLVIAAAIKVVSPGPVFFRQARVGHRRTLFLCWKFRSMKVGANEAAHEQHVEALIRSNVRMTKMDRLGDARLIPGGALLRATGLDELPQLFNVWRGEMSLVGPRPCMTYELENYSPTQLARFETLPGLTGLWQVSGKNRTTFSEMVDLDIRYVRERSLWSDLKIMTKTFSPVADQVLTMYRGRFGAENGPGARPPRPPRQDETPVRAA